MILLLDVHIDRIILSSWIDIMHYETSLLVSSNTFNLMLIVTPFLYLGSIWCIVFILLLSSCLYILSASFVNYIELDLAFYPVLSFLPFNWRIYCIFNYLYNCVYYIFYSYSIFILLFLILFSVGLCIFGVPFCILIWLLIITFGGLFPLRMHSLYLLPFTLN